MTVRKNAQRDYDIFVRRKNGETLSSLAKEFGLSVERIRQIIKKVMYECEMAKRYSEFKENINESLMGVDVLIIRYGAFIERHVIIRAYNALRYATPCVDYTKWNFENFLKKANLLSYDQLLKCRNIGVKTADFITMVKRDFAPKTNTIVKD